MCNVNVSEFRNNISYYIDLSSKETVNITKNGVVVAVLTNPDVGYYRTLVELFGCLNCDDSDRNYKDLIGEEILKKCGF